MSQQQTVLRVQTNIPHLTLSGQTQFTFLDLSADIPIKINKSFAELQDISKRNSDYSIGLILPGTKKNNRFFESFFNVDSQSLYFNATERVNCDVLLNDQSYFRGYMRLNRVSVMNSKIEYDVTLYSEVGDLFGQIGNNLLKDLDFSDTEYTFNHTFNFSGVTELMYQSNFYKDTEKPYAYFYPIVHNGYNYVNYSGATLPNFTGETGIGLTNVTRLYTSTSPINGYTGLTAAYNAGVQEYYINSPTQALYDNQLKPALSIWNLMKLIFKTYGYTISGDFMNTPWMKSLYLYGYFSSEQTKFSYKLNNIEQLPLEGCELIFFDNLVGDVSAIVCKKGTGVPCYCLSEIYGTMIWPTPLPAYFDGFVIPAGTSGYTATGITGKTFSETASRLQASNVTTASSSSLKYFPVAVGDTLNFHDGDPIDFSLVIDQNIKQIDILSSIAKKFNLIFITNPDNPKDIIIEPHDFYVGSGNIYDWTPKLSWDKGFTVEPALNYVESNLILTDLEDGDEGNRIFKLQNNRIYGENRVYNPTDFKSQEKKIDTIFSSELIRKWDNNIGLPLGINYSASSEQSTYDNQIRWLYKGVKSKPKLFFWLMGQNPFIDNVGEVFKRNDSYNTYTVKIQGSSGGTTSNFALLPSISHTMPLGLADQYKINNDSLSILFNSEQPVDIGVQTYDTYTEYDVYNRFYNNRITNIYDPNTRFLSGYFDLKYSDIQNLKWNDAIKINEQYFVINKISEFNLTNRELTKVELIQFNVNPQEYPNRYFKYQYCDQPGYCFKIKTDFTNPNLQDTNYIWSLYYDNQVGSLTGSTTGFTSTLRVLNQINFPTQFVMYVPYTMQEITEQEYSSQSCYDFSCDTLMNHVYTNPNGLIYSLSTFWESTGNTGVNVFESCSQFNSVASTYGIITGSSTSYGLSPCVPAPTPTPTPTSTGPTPTPTATPIYPTPVAGEGQYWFIGPQRGDSVYQYYYYPFTSSDTGVTWTEQTGLSRTIWNGFTLISQNGQYVYTTNGYGIGSLLRSTNYGSSFIVYGTDGTYVANFFVVAYDMSRSGQYVTTIGPNGSDGPLITFSNDYGATYSTYPLPSQPPYSYKGYTGLAVPDSGFPQYFIAQYGNKIEYLSSTGSTLQPLTNSYEKVYSSIATNSNGQYITAVEKGTGNIYVSSNSGTTWSIKTGLVTSEISSVKMSSSGQIQLMASFFNATNQPTYPSGKVYLSTDYGNSWSQVTLPWSDYNGYFYPNVSTTGKYLVVRTYNNIANGGGGFPNDYAVYWSQDYGVTWTKKSVPMGWVGALAINK